MVWSYWRSDQTLAHPWSLVSFSYWWRYPNPESSHVFSVDTLEEEVRGDLLYTKRLVIKTNSLPGWGKHFFNDQRVAVIEECLVDRSHNKLTWYTRNIGLARFMATVEKVSMTPSTSSTTNVIKECWINSSILGFRSAIKKFGTERYKKNCLTATGGHDWVIKSHLDHTSPCNRSGLVNRLQKSEVKEVNMVKVGLGSSRDNVEC